jgi:hypothetical protein
MLEYVVCKRGKIENNYKAESWGLPGEASASTG